MIFSDLLLSTVVSTHHNRALFTKPVRVQAQLPLPERPVDSTAMIVLAWLNFFVELDPKPDFTCSRKTGKIERMTMTKPLPDWLIRFRQRLAEAISEDVELIETHISWLLLAGGFAYKLKKPVTLPFLDYGSPASRHFFCDEELRLNRRFAPELYLDVVLVDAEADEWAVRMRRFAEAARLDHVCARGELTLAHLSDLAQVIIALHENSSATKADSRFGEPVQVLAQAMENLDELRHLLPAELLRLDQLCIWTKVEFARVSELIQRRKLAGRVRECHGDLHLGNLVLIDEQVTPFDCIEFNEDLRWIDVISELAFTYVDLLNQQRPDLAGWLLNEWLAGSGDFAAMPLLRFYALYRALVRAKVAGLRGDSADAEKYLVMAEKLIAPPEPTLTITFGLSGSGKTQSSRAMILADRTATTVHLRSDVERKRLYGLSANAPSQSGLASGIYAAEASARTYDHLAQTAAGLLANGWSVIVDAAFLERQRRDVFHALAVQAKVPFKILACTASTAVLRQRIEQRSGDASEATLAVLERQLAHVEPLAIDELPFTISA